MLAGCAALAGVAERPCCANVTLMALMAYVSCGASIALMTGGASIAERAGCT